MKYILISIVLFLIFPVVVKAQYSVSIVEGYNSKSIKVKTGNNLLFPDLTIKIGENILFSDFTIGFTDSKYTADVIIGDFYNPDFAIQLYEGIVSDISLKVSDNSLFSDIDIKIIKNGIADYLVYNSYDYLAKEDLVASLLPIINAHLKYKFDAIPFWSHDKGIGEPDEVLKPNIYCCPDLNHWIQQIKSGIIYLEDKSIWKVYSQDSYISLLWLPVDNIKLKPTSYLGHYYMTNISSYKTETVRVICLKE